MNRLEWYCMACGKGGSFEMAEGFRTICLLVELLRTSHDRLSPECAFGASRMQVRPLPAPARQEQSACT